MNLSKKICAVRIRKTKVLRLKDLINKMMNQLVTKLLKISKKKICIEKPLNCLYVLLYLISNIYLC